MTDMTRRHFLKQGCFTLALVSLPTGLTLVNCSTARAADENFKPHAFLEIAPDGAVTIWMGQTNLGQGTHTGIPMVIADELDADWSRVNSQMALAADAFKNPHWGAQGTGGSTSIRHRWDMLRKVGAGARLMLIQAAAARWKIDPAQCTADKGRVLGPGGKSLGYGELTGDAARLPVPEDPPLKSPDKYTIIGTHRDRLDLVDKVRGKTVFGLDMQLPDMLVAVLDRPPQYGAVPEAFDDKGALAVQGVEQVMVLDGKVAVCATNTWAALKGREALATKWSTASHPDLDDRFIDDVFGKKMAETGPNKSRGDVDKALAEAAVVVEAEYTVPFLAHAQLEPTNCTAFVEADRCRVWAPTQGQTAALMTAAGITGLPEEKVEVMTTFCGGGFGRRAEAEVVGEAVSLSKATGHPVKVMWTREDEFADDVFRPASVCRIRGGLNADGNLTAWKHKIASPSIMARVMPDAVQDGMDGSSIQGVSDIIYTVPDGQVEYVLVDLPMRVGWWRSVGYSYNAFTVESFMDELAHRAGKDPVKFRLDSLEADSRPRKLLTALAEKAAWASPVPSGRGRGVALTSCFGSLAGHMAEVSVDRATGLITVHRMVCAVDCGTAVYPDAIHAQMESGVVMGMSAAFNEKVHFDKGGVSTANYSGYPLLTMTQVPEIEVHIVASGDVPGGIGEPGLPSVAPAIANAIFAATGVRLRELPFDTDKLKA